MGWDAAYYIFAKLSSLENLGKLIIVVNGYKLHILHKTNLTPTGCIMKNYVPKVKDDDYDIIFHIPEIKSCSPEKLFDFIECIKKSMPEVVKMTGFASGEEG